MYVPWQRTYVGTSFGKGRICPHILWQRMHAHTFVCHKTYVSTSFANTCPCNMQKAEVHPCGTSPPLVQGKCWQWRATREHGPGNPLTCIGCMAATTGSGVPCLNISGLHNMVPSGECHPGCELLAYDMGLDADPEAWISAPLCHELASTKPPQI